MKVVCVNKGIVSPLSDIKDHAKEGVSYTVRCEETGFSAFAQREVDAYGFQEIDGLYEKSMFISLSDFDERLLILLRTNPFRNKKMTNEQEPERSVANPMPKELKAGKQNETTINT